MKFFIGPDLEIDKAYSREKQVLRAIQREIGIEYTTGIVAQPHIIGPRTNERSKTLCTGESAVQPEYLQ